MEINGIVLIGPPGCGKSTIGKTVASRHGMTYVSSGDIARRIAEHDMSTYENLKIGKMADEDAMRNEIRSTLYDLNYAGKIFILDGFPRNMEQYLWLRKIYPSLLYYVVDVPNTECVSRIRERNREDVDTTDQRMKYYNELTKPMISLVGLVTYVRNQYSPEFAVNSIINDLLAKNIANGDIKSGR